MVVRNLEKNVAGRWRKIGRLLSPTTSNVFWEKIRHNVGRRTDAFFWLRFELKFPHTGLLPYLQVHLTHHLASLQGHFWVTFGTFFGTLFASLFGALFGPLQGNFLVMLGSLLGHALGNFWETFGSRLVLLFDNFKNSFGIIFGTFYKIL